MSDIQLVEYGDESRCGVLCCGVVVDENWCSVMVE